MPDQPDRKAIGDALMRHALGYYHPKVVDVPIGLGVRVQDPPPSPQAKEEPALEADDPLAALSPEDREFLQSNADAMEAFRKSYPRRLEEEQGKVNEQRRIQERDAGYDRVDRGQRLAREAAQRTVK